MAKKNGLVIGLAVGACVLLLAAGLIINRTAPLSGEALPLEGLLSASPAAVEPTALPDVAPEPLPSPGQAGETLYLIVTVGQQVYQPIPLDGEREFTVAQEESGASNTVHISPTGIYMAAANCHNQDCVRQGEVTGENRDARLLGNLIVCLPNQVTLQLCTAQEAEQMITLEP